MPYTAKQRRMFNARAGSDPEMAKLAQEANSMARSGHERPPVRKAEPGKRHALPMEMPVWMEKAAESHMAGPKRTPRKAK